MGADASSLQADTQLKCVCLVQKLTAVLRCSTFFGAMRYQIDRVNSRNVFCHDDSTMNIACSIIIIVIVIIIVVIIIKTLDKCNLDGVKIE